MDDGMQERGTGGAGSVRVLLGQLAPVPGDVAANLATAQEVVGAHPDVDLVVLPELFLPGYTLADIERLALDPDDARLAPLQGAAARHRTAVVVGFAEKIAGRPPANSALCIDESGEVAGVYRKVHLFGAEVEYFTRGDRYLLARLCGRDVGPLICYDVEFPEPARALALAGAQLLVTVSANMVPFGPEHALFARARALENRRPHVYVNRVGAESGFTFVGGSCAVDATGEPIDAAAHDAGCRVVDVRSGPTPLPDYLAERCPGVPVVRAESLRPH